MAGFRKAKGEQAALKMGFYGLPGSGKTLTALMVAEGLAERIKKRVAYVDTERGTDFYCKAVPERKVHPEAFDFDALYTRSITEIDRELRGLCSNTYGVVIIDSVTHLWEACKAAYSGATNRAGAIPIHAWAKIKSPYKKLFDYMMSSPMHFIICGRQGSEFDTDETTGEMKKIGVKIKAESETGYEPHLMINMEAVREADGRYINYAFVEKDRTGILRGAWIPNPTFADLGAPLLSILGNTQAKLRDEDETAKIDSESLALAESKITEASSEVLRDWWLKFETAKTVMDLDKIQKNLTSDIKKTLTTVDLKTLRGHYLAALARLTGTSIAAEGAKDE